MRIVIDDRSRGVHPFKSFTFGEIEVEPRLEEFTFKVIGLVKNSMHEKIRRRIRSITAHFEHFVGEPRSIDSEDLRLVLTADIEPNIVVGSPEWANGMQKIGSGFILFPEFKLGSRMVEPEEIAKSFIDRIFEAISIQAGGLEAEARKLRKILESQNQKGNS